MQDRCPLNYIVLSVSWFSSCTLVNLQCHHWGKLGDGTHLCTIFTTVCESVIISNEKVGGENSVHNQLPCVDLIGILIKQEQCTCATTENLYTDSVFDDIKALIVIFI